MKQLRLWTGALVIGGIVGGHGANSSPAQSKPAQSKPAQSKPAAPKAGAGAAKKKEEPATPPPPMRPLVIAKVDLNRREAVMASAAQIDRLIEANYAKFKISPNPVASDEVFVRRAHLEIAGTIPTLKETKDFLVARDSQKRARLIDRLLNSRGYSSHFFNYWGDVLRISDRLANNVPGRPYGEWVKVCLETNKPYDQMVIEMLTAEGKVFDNPAAGYVLRDTGMPLDAMNNTVRIFLGTQIGCAQCHDHPFDRWKQKEFYQMAAFTAGTQTRRNARDPKSGKNVLTSLREDLKKVDPSFDGGGKYNKFLAGNLMEVWDNSSKLKLPHDYAYANAKAGDVVPAKAIFDPPAQISSGETPRVAFARWLTSPDNPRFAKTISNRLWKKAFGVGQIEPIDDLKDDSVAENPALMEHLTQEMVRLKFDMKEYLRILFNTKAWQRESSVAELEPDKPYHFPGPVLRRMSAEQVWDSFITLAIRDPHEYQIEPARVQSQLLDVDLANATAEQIHRRDEELREATSRQAKLAREKAYQYKGLLLVRASELPIPTPPGHFLRQFGQSDHESIEAASRDGNVPQVLQMFNGNITHGLLEGKSLLFEQVTSAKDRDGRIDVIFLSILNRKPSSGERQAAVAEITKNDNAGYGNVIWALVNTREFLFVQ